MEYATSSTLVDLKLGPCKCQGCGQPVHWDGRSWVQLVGKHLALEHRCRGQKPVQRTETAA